MYEVWGVHLYLLRKYPRMPQDLVFWCRILVERELTRLLLFENLYLLCSMALVPRCWSYLDSCHPGNGRDILPGIFDRCCVREVSSKQIGIKISVLKRFTHHISQNCRTLLKSYSRGTEREEEMGRVSYYREHYSFVITLLRRNQAKCLCRHCDRFMYASTHLCIVLGSIEL